MALRIHKVINVITSSQIDTATNGNNNYDNEYHKCWFLLDNASQAYGQPPLLLSVDDDNNNNATCSACPNEHLIWKVLRWIKLIAIKIGRSYYALPTALLVAVLLLGLLVGFVIGRRYEKQRLLVSKQGTSNRLTKNDRPLLFSVWCCDRFLDVERIIDHWLWNGSKSSAKVDSENKVHFNCSILKAKSASSRIITQSLTANESVTPLLHDANNDNIDAKEQVARVKLKSDTETERESGLSDEELPLHVAVIMDGNRRYGEREHGNAMQGHWDGSRKLLQFAKWCLAEHISELTVYAFSTENWQRDATEVASLMGLIAKHCEELRVEAVVQQICVRIHSTDAGSAIPSHIRTALRQLEEETKHGTALRLNVCLSYGSRGEIVEACRTLAEDYRAGRLTTCTQINERAISEQMLISEPDLLIRTSGEIRISNFLLWQLAYAELFFLDKYWPELEKQDFLDVLKTYARGRQRRFGK